MMLPPFSEENGIAASYDIILPTVIQDTDNRSPIFPDNEMERFLAFELCTPKLSKLHSELWLAGLPLPARPLQRQAMMGRAFHITERPDEHLVWYQTKLLLKPLPDYLLHYWFWEKHLCANPALYRSAAGLLLSYTWLIQHRSDLSIALKEGLLPPEVDWRMWTRFTKSFHEQIQLDQVDQRYLYGELRLSRLNSMMRFLPSMWSKDNFVRGYLPTSTWYQAFFETNFSWYLAAFAFISIILSAMQVGLATAQLEGNRQFANMSYGISLLSIALVFFGLGLMWIVWLFLFCYHILSTRNLNKEIQKERSITLRVKV